MDLNNISPFLSEEVLMAITNRSDAFNSQQLATLLTNNPDILNPNLRNYIINSPHSISSNSLEAVFSNQDEITERTQIEEKLATYRLKMHDSANRVLRELLLLEETIDFEEIRIWLENKDNLRVNYDIVESYMQEALFNEALEQLNYIDNTYVLSDFQQQEHDFYEQLKKIQINLSNSGRSDWEMNTTEITDIANLAEKSQGLAGVQARNWLNSGYSYDFEPITIYPQVANSPLTNPFDENNRTVNNILVYAYPNPAFNQINFQLSYPRINGNTKIQITDIHGRIVEQLNISENTTQLSWNIPSNLSGIYLYRLELDGIIQDSKKLIIIQ